MGTEALTEGNQAFVEEEFDKALDLYSQAIQADPNNPKIYECRSACHLKLENYLEAAEDAAKAIELDPSMAKAYLRKGIACFHLEEYESAKQAFDAGAKLAPDQSQFKTWIRKCQAEIDDAEEPAPATTQPAPTQPVPVPAPVPAPAPAAPASASTPAPAPAAPSSQPAVSALPLARAAPVVVEGKYRHQWYQLQNKVTVDVYAKNLKQEQVSVSFGEQQLTVIISTAGEEDYRLDVKLYGKIDPAQSRVEVLKTKVEITMTKANTLQWGSLEVSTQVAAPAYSNPDAAPVAGKYPSSYAKAPKDWDKVEAEVKDLEQKGELDDGDPLNNFFKKIFSQGDEDQRRAMMKSFVESNGTVLSTNWQEVGTKKVECTPPDGMVAKKWGQE